MRMVPFLLLLPLASSFVHGNNLQIITPTTSKKTSLLRRDSFLTHPTDSNDVVHPSLVSKLFFRYVDPLIQKSKNERLDVMDALPIENQRNAKLGEREIGLSRIYNRVKQRHYRDSPSQQLARALLLDNRKRIFTSGMLRLANTLVQAFPAMIISRLLKLMEAGAQEPMQKSTYLVLLLVSVLSVKMILENQYFHRAIQTSLSVRASLSDMIFSKSLELPSGGSGQVINKQNSTLGAGGVMSLLQSDCGNIENSFLQIHTAWDAPLQIGIYTALLYRFMGPSILYGIGVLIAVIPINMLMLRILHRLLIAETDAREARTKLTAESIRNMKILKLLSWDTTERIEQFRRTELRRHSTRGALKALNSAISNAVPAVVLVVTMSAYKGPIVASIIFTAISLFNQLRFPLFFLPMFLDAMANGWNSMTRVSSFLSATGNAEYILRKDSATVRVRSGNFFWPSTTIPALKDVNVDVQSGEIVAVVGSVGTGKTAFIKCLLGELQPVPANVISSSSHSAEHPTVEIGNTSYCSQDAWLPKGTLKEAIVFGRPFDKSRYVATLYTAGLDQDFSSGTLEDETDVGEGGSSLSGGQRARVALARALYSSDAKVILLDDCLAALDAKVGGLVFARLQTYAKNNGVSVVLATNNQDFSRRCDKIVIMGRDGDSSVVVDVGSFMDLKARGHSLSGPQPPIKEEPARDEAGSLQSKNLVDGDILTSTRGADSTETSMASCESPFMRMEKCPDCISHPKVNEVEQRSSRKTPDIGISLMKQENAPVSEMKLVTSADDNMTTGAVPLKTYTTYLKSVGSPLVIMVMVAAFLMTNGAQFFQQYTIAKWAEAEAGAGAARYMKALTGAAVSVSIFLWIRSFLITRVGVLASRFWHKRMLKSVFSAPMGFFDVTPSGQLLSRFGKEIETVDRSVPDSIGSFLYCFLQIGTSVAALVGVITPAMLVPLFLVGFLYVGVMALFRPAARDMKRVETFSRSPIYTNFGEAIRGSEVIRSVPGAIQVWNRKHRDLTNTNLGVFGSVKALDRWLSMRLETLGNMVVLATCFSSIVLSRSGRLKAGSAGWGLTQSLAITGLMAWTVRTLTDLESNMMSVMRVQELTDVDLSDSTESIIPKESDENLYPQLSKSIQVLTSPEKSHSLIQSGWPWEGHVSFCNVSMRYSPNSPLVLNRVSIDIPKGTTLGVVGRTGSGKSSLLLTLFRLVEIEGDGFIQIDGVDIRSVALNELRRSLAIIPQVKLFAVLNFQTNHGRPARTPFFLLDQLHTISTQADRYLNTTCSLRWKLHHQNLRSTFAPKTDSTRISTREERI